MDQGNSVPDDCDDQHYYRQIESHWSLRRENQIILSPVEFECMEKWYADSIPLSVVCRAIDRFVLHKKSGGRRRRFLLVHVDDLVRKQFAEYQSLHVGEGEEKGGLDVTQRLNVLIAGVRRVIGEHKGMQIEHIAQELEGICPEDVVSLEDLETQLMQIDEAFFAAFKSLLSDDERRILEAEVSDFVEREDDPELFERLFSDLIRVHFQIPRLTVLG